MDAVSIVLSQEDVVRSIFDCLDFAPVCRFALASRQLRADVASKFLTTIDVHDKLVLSSPSLNSSVEYLVASTPSRTLPCLRQLLLRKRKEFDFPTLFANIKRSLPNLTTLYLLIPEPENLQPGADEPALDQSVAAALRECISLTTLWFGGSMFYLESLLSIQPKLNTLGISFLHSTSPSFGTRSFELINGLEHRPKIVSITPSSNPISEALPEHWARGVDCVLLNGLLFEMDTIINAKQRISYFERNFRVPLSKTWWFRYPKEPFKPFMPFVTRLLDELGDPWSELFSTIESHQPPNLAVSYRAASYQRLLTGQRDPVMFEVVARNLLSEANVAPGEFPHPVIWLLIATSHFGINLSQLVLSLTLYKPLETVAWAIRTTLMDFYGNTSYADDWYLSPTLAKTFPNTRIQRILLGDCHRWPIGMQNEILEELSQVTDPRTVIQFLGAPPEHQEQVSQILRSHMPLPDDILRNLSSRASEPVFRAICSEPDMFGIAPEVFVSSEEFIWLYLSHTELFPAPLQQYLETYDNLAPRLLRHYRVSESKIPCARLFCERTDFGRTKEWTTLLHVQNLLCLDESTNQKGPPSWWTPSNLRLDVRGYTVLNLLMRNLGESPLMSLLHRAQADNILRRDIHTALILAFDNASAISSGKIDRGVLDALLAAVDPAVLPSFLLHIGYRTLDTDLQDHLLIKILTALPSIDTIIHRPHDMVVSEGKYLLECFLRSRELALFVCGKQPYIPFYDLSTGWIRVQRVQPEQTLWYLIVEKASSEVLDAVIAACPVLPHDGLIGRAEHAEKALEQRLFHLALASLHADTLSDDNHDYLCKVAFPFADRFWKRFNKELKELLEGDITRAAYIWTDGVVKTFPNVLPTSQAAEWHRQLTAWYRTWDSSRFKACLAMSSKLICRAAETTNLSLFIQPHFLLFASRDNWDGMLAEAATFMKQFSSHQIYNDMKIVFITASMIAAYNMGNLKLAKKHAALIGEIKSNRSLSNGALPFQCLESDHIFSSLTTESLLETTSRSHTSSSLLPSSSPSSSQQVSQKKPSKKKKKSKPSAAPSEQPPSVATTSSSSSAAISAIPSLASAVAGNTTTSSSSLQPADASRDREESEILNVKSSSLASSSSSPVLEKPIATPKEGARVSPARLVYAECSVCLENFPDWAAGPCGHVLCEVCINKVHRCPICRQEVQQRLRLFLSASNDDHRDAM